ncbi:MAG: arylsulfatase [Planctomycetota bacterium]
MSETGKSLFPRLRNPSGIWQYTAFIGMVMSLLFSRLATAEQPDLRQTDERPNIIYIMLDDAGYNDFGHTGSKFIKTPNFDSICREGIFFNNHYSGSAVCAPTRCVLMTGLHSGHCKRRDNKATGNLKATSNGLVFLDESDLTVAKHLQQAGYVTGGIGKWGLGNSGTTGSPDRQGFDHFVGYLDQVHAHNHYTDWLWKDGDRLELPENKDGQQGTYVHDVLEQETYAFIRQHAAGDKPFFLYLPYTLPHGKYEIPSNDPNLNHYRDQPWSQSVKNYAAMVTRADQTVGNIMALLKQLKIDDNTIIFYTSDNGPNKVHAVELGSGEPFRGIKRQLTEGGLRAAMAVRWPGRIKPGQTNDLAWSMIDVFPTLSELAQRETPKGLDGVSVVPTLLGNEANQRPIESIYFEIHHPFQQAVRMGKWKGMRFGTEHPMQLYDLSSDPHEDRNLAGQNPKIVQQINAIMKREHVESPFYPSVKQPKKKKKRKQ